MRGSHLEVVTGQRLQADKQSIERFYRKNGSALNQTAPLGQLYKPSQILTDP